MLHSYFDHEIIDVLRLWKISSFAVYPLRDQSYIALSWRIYLLGELALQGSSSRAFLSNMDGDRRNIYSIEIVTYFTTVHKVLSQYTSKTQYERSKSGIKNGTERYLDESLRLLSSLQ